jgi:hypothetical protein
VTRRTINTTAIAATRTATMATMTTIATTVTISDSDDQ